MSWLLLLIPFEVLAMVCGAILERLENKKVNADCTDMVSDWGETLFSLGFILLITTILFIIRGMEIE